MDLLYGSLMKDANLGQRLGDESASPLINWHLKPAVSEELIGEKESVVLTVNRCSFQHDFSTQTVHAAKRRVQ